MPSTTWLPEDESASLPSPLIWRNIALHSAPMSDHGQMEVSREFPPNQAHPPLILYQDFSYVDVVLNARRGVIGLVARAS